jgi:hypothetical protein
MVYSYLSCEANNMVDMVAASRTVQHNNHNCNLLVHFGRILLK